LILAWREPRRVLKRLTLQYDKSLYLIDDTPQTRSLAGHYVDIYPKRKAKEFMPEDILAALQQSPLP